MRERVRRGQVHKNRVIVELKRLDGQGRMASAMGARIARIEIIVLLTGGTRALVGCGHFCKRCASAGCCRVTLHGMGAFMGAMNRDGQNDRQESPGNEFQVDYSSHDCCVIMADYT